MRTALRHDDPLDPPAAADARLTFPSIGLMQSLESAALAVGIHIIRNRRTPMLDSDSQDFHDRSMQVERARLR